MEDEIIDLKCVNWRYTNNNEKSNSCKNYIILCLIKLLINSFISTNNCPIN